MDTLLINIFNWFVSPMVLPHLPALVIGACFGIYFVAMGFQRNRITQFAEGMFVGLVIAAFAWALYQGHGMSELASLPVPLNAGLNIVHAALAVFYVLAAAAVTALMTLIVWSLARCCLPKRPICLRSN